MRRPSDYGYATSGGSTTYWAACLNQSMSNWMSCSSDDWLYKGKLYYIHFIIPLADSSYATLTVQLMILVIYHEAVF